MKTRNARRPRRNLRTARKFGRGLPRRRPGALSDAGNQIAKLQQQLEAGEIDADEFESQLEQLEAQQRHSRVAQVMIRRARRQAAVHTAAVDPADVVLLNNAVKQLSKMEDRDHAVRMLRDIIDASQEMMKELEG